MAKRYGFLWCIKNVDLIKFIKYNFLSSVVVSENKARFYPLKGTKLDLKRSSRIYLQGNLIIGNNRVRGSKRETYLLLGERAQLHINGDVMLNYGCHMQAHADAHIALGTSVINTDSVIVIEKELEIGQDVLMGRFVTIFDSDFHTIRDEQGNRTNPPRKVTIGNHVWIGTKATILKGTKIKDGAVISANAYVGGVVKENALFSALPGQMFGTVEWGKVPR